MKRAILYWLLMFSLVCVVRTDAAGQGKSTNPRAAVDVGTYEVSPPPAGEWTTDTDPESGTVRFERVLRHPTEATRTASATSIQVVRIGTEIENWGLAEAKVAESYLKKQEEKAKDELGRGSSHEVRFLGRETATVGRKKLYSMRYQASKPEVTVDAAIYLYFPDDYRKHHVFYVFFISDAYAKELHKPDLAVVNQVIESLKVKSRVFPQAALQRELLKAIDSGNTPKVRYLLQQGADVNGTNSGGWSPLMVAASRGHAELVTLLLDKGARVNEKTPQGQTPLIFAAHWGHMGAVNVLLDKGADVDAQMADGWTALVDAAQMDKVDVATLLIQKGADVKKRTRTGWTALMAASFNNRIELVKFLLEKGADVNVRDEAGKTALGVAKAKGHTEIVHILSEAGGAE